MRKLLLLSVVVMTAVVSNAQAVYRDNSIQRSRLEETPVVVVQHPNTSNTHRRESGSRAVSNSIKLNSQRLGSSGNLLTVNNGTANQIDVNDDLNVVTFIHRNDPNLFGGTVATYRYDLSKNGGTTFITDIGTITNDTTIDNIKINGRFPQALIYNPTGNSIVDSGYLIYSGTWHNGSDGWKGEMRGRGNLTTDSSKFNVSIDSVNNGGVNIAGGFCQGEPGVFWNVNQDFPGMSFVSGTSLITRGIVITKGVWNSVTRDVDWTERVIPVTFATNATGTSTSATSFNIAFDPTGQYGWIACLGDVNNDNEKTLEPVFWRTTDFGANWSGPTQISLKDINGVVARLNPTFSNGDPSSRIPTTAFDEDLVVDYKGNPHMLVVIGNGTGDYSIQAARYNLWDITFDANAPSCDTVWNGGWKGNYVSDVRALRGSLSNDNPAPQTQDNRPLASRSRDGKKLFFFWVDSDVEFIGADQNDLPNLYTRAYDLETFTSTKPYSLTEGDSLWGGETSLTSGGIFGGATFGTIAPIASQRGSTFNVPLVLTQIDYNHDPEDGLGSYLNPCAFWYINNVNFDPYDFTESKSVVVQLNGADTVSVLLGTTYTDESANIIYLDTLCYPSGELYLEVDESDVDYENLGTYKIRYYAKDANGVIHGGITRVVVIGTPPIADFSYTAGSPVNKINFRDLSQFSPTYWTWDYGDGRSGAGAAVKNPSHLYPNVDSTYNVCLTATNSYGASLKVCKPVTVRRSTVGINEVEFANAISMFPNPSNGKVTLKLNEEVNGDVTVSIIDMLGRTVVTPTKYNTSTIEMNLNSLSGGFYMVKITANNKTAIKQLTLTGK